MWADAVLLLMPGRPQLEITLWEAQARFSMRTRMQSISTNRGPTSITTPRGDGLDGATVGVQPGTAGPLWIPDGKAVDKALSAAPRFGSATFAPEHGVDANVIDTVA